MPIRQEKSYSGELMRKGECAESVVYKWLSTRNNVKTIFDVRSMEIMQNLDIDFLITLSDGRKHAVEVKSDIWISESGNFLFETYRINHTISDPRKRFYEGWGTRSGADILFVVNPKTQFGFLFKDFTLLRNKISNFIRNKNTQEINTLLKCKATDKIKTTFFFTIPMNIFKEDYTKINFSNTELTPQDLAISNNCHEAYYFNDRQLIEKIYNEQLEMKQTLNLLITKERSKKTFKSSDPGTMELFFDENVVPLRRVSRNEKNFLRP